MIRDCTLNDLASCNLLRLALWPTWPVLIYGQYAFIKNVYSITVGCNIVYTSIKLGLLKVFFRSYIALLIFFPFISLPIIERGGFMDLSSPLIFVNVCFSYLKVCESKFRIVLSFWWITFYHIAILKVE